MKKTFLIFIGSMLAGCASLPGMTPATNSTPVENSITLPTLTPSPTPVPTPTPVPDGPCDNPLVPLAAGNQWTYRVTTDRGETFYTLRTLEIRDIGNLVSVVEFGNESETVQEAVICQDGAIENFPLFVMDMLFADVLNKFMNTYHDTGLYAPSYNSFAENDWMLDWEADYLTEDSASIRDPLSGQTLSLVQSSPIDLSFTTDGTREVVEVPAGNFPNTLKVRHSFTVSATLGANGGHLILESTHWYEPYVGLVRAQVDTGTYSIAGFKSSVSLNSLLELMEFAQEN